jgi:hypothetical protein
MRQPGKHWEQGGERSLAIALVSILPGHSRATP